MARVLIVSSSQDIAGQMMHEHLRSHYPFTETSDTFDGRPVLQLDSPHARDKVDVKLVVSNKELFASEHLESQFPADLIICLSRHTSQSHAPGLLVHSTGNWGEDASLGGQPRQVAIAPGPMIRGAVRLLDKAQEQYGLSSFPVTMEVTHHGPTTMDTPLLFLEVGSTPEQWRDPAPTKAVAEVGYQLATTCREILREPVQPVLGVGGTHYCPRFNLLIRSTEYATCHIIPKYHIDSLTFDVFKRAITRSHPPAQAVVIDWKGLNGPQREKISRFVDQLADPKIKLLRLNRLLKEEDS